MDPVEPPCVARQARWDREEGLRGPLAVLLRQSARGLRVVLLLGLAITVSCGHTAHAPAGSLDTGVRLSLRRTNGDPLELGSLRGAPVLLFVFATWDAVSQAMLNPVGAVALAHPELHVVAIGAQPDAADLLPLWEHALEPAFPVTYDPAGQLAQGRSALGEIDAIPLVILLDRRGQVAQRHVGFASRQTLEAMVARLPN